MYRETVASTPAMRCPGPSDVGIRGMSDVDRQTWRIRITTGGRVLGAGVLLTLDTVLTCAHVVSDAVGAGLDRPVDVDFPGSASRVGLRAVPRRDAWVPVAADESGDLALLSLIGQLPTDVRPARLTVCGAPAGRAVRAFGHPRGLPAGVWARARLVGVGGPSSAWIQFDAVDLTGRDVSSGFSGAGVVDDLGAVLGIVVAADRQPDARVSWMVPTESLVAQLPALASMVGPTGGAAPPRPTPGASPKPAQVQRLARLLSTLPALRDPASREQVVAGLRTEIAAAVPRHPTTLIDVYGIVRTCLDYRGGLDELVSVLRGFSGDSNTMEKVDELLTEMRLD